MRVHRLLTFPGSEGLTIGDEYLKHSVFHYSTKYHEMLPKTYRVINLRLLAPLISSAVTLKPNYRSDNFGSFQKEPLSVSSARIYLISL